MNEISVILRLFYTTDNDNSIITQGGQGVGLEIGCSPSVVVKK